MIVYLRVLIGKIILLSLQHLQNCISSMHMNLETHFYNINNFQTWLNWIWGIPNISQISPSIIYLNTWSILILSLQVMWVENHSNSFLEVSLTSTYPIQNQSSIVILNTSLELWNMHTWTMQYTWVTFVFLTYLHIWNSLTWSSTLRSLLPAFRSCLILCALLKSMDL